MEPASLPWFTLHPNFAAMLLNEKLRDRQTEACALADARRSRRKLVKRLKDGFLFFSRNADSRIYHGDGKQRPFASRNQTDLPFFRCELDRVARCEGALLSNSVIDTGI